MSAEELAVLICRSLLLASRVEIEGLGVFRRDETGKISFDDLHRRRVFIAYAAEDALPAERLYSDLKQKGYEPWLDTRRLMPGQNWPLRIREAIEGSDFFIACFSRNSTCKRGGFQTEVRLALECANRVPLDEIFFIPVRLDACRVPASITRETQYVNLFPDWESGFDRLVATMEKHGRRPASG